MIDVYWSPVINVQDNQEFVSELKYYEPETIYKDIKPKEFFGLGAGMCPAIVDEAKNTFRAKSPIDFHIKNTILHMYIKQKIKFENHPTYNFNIFFTLLFGIVYVCYKFNAIHTYHKIK